ncbi:hypothetical protein SLH49_02105 [Cognatiyoonia sp. IB215446]|uniref:hypothetical protein n=1 Tax=Cognatiyoonia sp. IB215446 TaxID=3097355 RepID=UPI002A13FD42|nr:hypothetical protein [Cognatiyoonia sp. IB215446]MDX8346768.1 hypothetical protein [Cognatiyoonia sp. IB215446]
MKFLCSLFVCLVAASSGVSQPFETRASDTVLDAKALSALILGRELEFYDGGKSRYSPGGSYSWTYSAENGGGSWFGTHFIDADGTVCIDFRTLRGRCDKFVQAGDRLILLTEDGQRFPVREIR